MPYTPNKIVSGTLKADYNLFWNSLAPFYDDHRAPAQDLSADPQLTSPSAFAYKFDEEAVWQRTVTVHDILAAYRAKYLPKASSPVLGSGIRVSRVPGTSWVRSGMGPMRRMGLGGRGLAANGPS